ncbi:sugar phosphate nucleotidyltransferase [Anaerosalibacter sp. Marseille-P3206]|uniref:sugar phosphate nucleotidyltransferase n=1 Tax=Anaerosalibacter sp. Marseille-P3206 TaxID=1871005 RepID=UPI000984B1D3|nr:sugar phosphate nucleotidyltransferase [Anaerosalibacter sp. Marseille-P3206]
MIEIKAVIMSGGKGTRLRPLTCNIPKPMVPIMNKPVMEYSVNLLKSYGIEDIAVTLHYMPSSIIDYFGNGEQFGVKMNYYIEESPLGTGGSVKNAEEFLDSTFLVVSGDAFTNMDFQKALDFHKKKKSKATLVLKREPIPLEYGVVITDENGRITRFLEKPSWGEVFSDTINTGIYILEPEVLDYYKKGENFDFSKDLFPRLLKDNVPMYGYVTEEYWNDIGDINSYIKTHEDLLNKRVHADFKSEEIEDGIWVGDGTLIERGVQIIPPVYIGKNCIIKNGTVLDSDTVIGDNSYIDNNCSLKRTIMWDTVFLSKDVETRKAIICDSVQIKDHVKLFEGSVIGSSSTVLKRAVVSPNIKIWPHKLIEENTKVNENLVWGSKVSKNIFGSRNIGGNINIDINPEFATRLGSSYATVVSKDGVVIVSSDEHNSSKLVKNSLVSGILSTGAKVIDISDATLPMCRFAVRYFSGNGGIHISSNSNDKNMIQIELINKSGANIDRNFERKIENAFSSEGFTRCNGDRIEDVTRIYSFSSMYIREGRKLLKNESTIKRENPKVMISSISGKILLLARKYLESIGCQVTSRQLENAGESELKAISREVVEGSFDLGLFYSENGENMTLIDDKGNVMDREKFSLLSILMGLKSGELDKIVVPYNFPRVVEDLVRDYGGKVYLTKTNLADLLNEIFKQGSIYQYIINFDAILGTGKILDYLVSYKIKLSDLIEQLPVYYYVKGQVKCPWEEKGRILRYIIENDDNPIETVEGARIVNDKGWVLILPDNEKPIFNIYAEGFSEEYAEELSNLYYEKINEILSER